MSVYVGAAEWPFGRMMMCHMTADSTEELLRMVDAIGVQRKWIQYEGTPKEHFDICKSKRTKAIQCGAIEVDHQQEADMLRAKTIISDAKRTR